MFLKHKNLINFLVLENLNMLYLFVRIKILKYL